MKAKKLRKKEVRMTKVIVSDQKVPLQMESEELLRLQFCNSKNLPKKIRIRNQTLEWVGIGWIPVDPDPEATIIVKDKNEI